MGEKVLIAVCLVVGQLAALGLLILVRGWLKEPRPSGDWWQAQWGIPPRPRPPPPTVPTCLPESGIVIHRKKICVCQHGCKSGECDK
jgi:hypothetical protein